MNMSTRNFILVAVVLLAGLTAVAQRKGKKAAAAVAGDTIPAAAIMQSEGDLQHPTPRQECRFLIRDSRQRLWTLGVENPAMAV